MFILIAVTVSLSFFLPLHILSLVIHTS